MKEFFVFIFYFFLFFNFVLPGIFLGLFLFYFFTFLLATRKSKMSTFFFLLLRFY